MSTTIDFDIFRIIDHNDNGKFDYDVDEILAPSDAKDPSEMLFTGDVLKLSGIDVWKEESLPEAAYRFHVDRTQRFADSGSLPELKRNLAKAKNSAEQIGVEWSEEDAAYLLEMGITNCFSLQDEAVQKAFAENDLEGYDAAVGRLRDVHQVTDLYFDEDFYQGNRQQLIRRKIPLLWESAALYSKAGQVSSVAKYLESAKELQTSLGLPWGKKDEKNAQALTRSAYRNSSRNNLSEAANHAYYCDAEGAVRRMEWALSDAQKAGDKLDKKFIDGIDHLYNSRCQIAAPAVLIVLPDGSMVLAERAMLLRAPF